MRTFRIQGSVVTTVSYEKNGTQGTEFTKYLAVTICMQIPPAPPQMPLMHSLIGGIPMKLSVLTVFQ
jgi:hypothetical protein